MGPTVRDDDLARVSRLTDVDNDLRRGDPSGMGDNRARFIDARVRSVGGGAST